MILKDIINYITFFSHFFLLALFFSHLHFSPLNVQLTHDLCEKKVVKCRCVGQGQDPVGIQVEGLPQFDRPWNPEARKTSKDSWIMDGYIVMDSWNMKSRVPVPALLFRCCIPFWISYFSFSTLHLSISKMRILPSSGGFCED